jgi:UDP-glucose 4-epimerase
VGLRIAITGSGGYLAQRLITRLGMDPDVEMILGFDIRQHTIPLKCQSFFLHYDITKPWNELRDHLVMHKINTGLHLAWQFNPIHNVQYHRRVDVEGSKNFFRAAEAAGLRRIVYTSSATAYVNPEEATGDRLLPEETPVSGTPLYLYSKHKAEVDRLAQEFMAQHADVQVLILRPSIVLGRYTRNIVTAMLEWPGQKFPWMFQVRGADPAMQFVSEDDMTEVLFRAVKGEARGIVNVAGDGIVRYSEMVRAVGKKPLRLPAGLLYPMAAALWKLHLAPFPPGMLDMIRYPWVGDTTRLKKEFGFEPRMDTKQSLEAFVAAQPKKRKRRR